MSLFQASVINKHLKTQDKQAVQAAYARFKAHFHNAAIQENIRNSKEEQYQEGFLNDLFVNVLGYVKNPTPEYNLTTEYKNVKDSKKADGAIVIGNVVKAVIELKGTNTTDLGNVEAQAFGYKNNQPQCVYVVTSNFEKLRFYIDNAIEHLEFNLFTLTEKEFETLYLCLAFTSIEIDIPKKIKEESISQEDKVTKELYNDYSLFKRELHRNLVALNPEYDALLLFKKSQKLLDRYLFLFFAEDRQLLPPNSVRLILSDWKELQERDVEIPLYDRFKKYFGYLNTGYKGKRYDVFAYNGGLFKPDEVLDNVTIDDELLYNHARKLSEYDFESEVDVNILGHIFENSLNELDEVKAQLSGAEVDKTKSRRKKDGVFYTPKYITKYIVDNTVGKLCTDKKVELGIKEEDYFSDKKRNKTTKQPLADRLNAYREWLLQITICDPACGSGAFLNQALNFLIDEHRTIDEMQAKLFGDSLVLSDIENIILENNLFGVDLNEESVEIAKLSLWLRTAQPNRKLNDLSNNIKCGNSLIDDPAVAGEKAFDWEQEFPQVFTPGKEQAPIVKPEKDETPDYLQLIKEKSLEAQTKSEQAIALSKEAMEISRKVYEYARKLEAVSEPNSIYGIRKGGFDVVIGNPPYVVYIKSIVGEQTVNYINDKFNYAEYNPNTYALFTELALDSLLKKNGYLGFIIPNSWLEGQYFSRMRRGVYSKNFKEILNLKGTAFHEIVETVIVHIKNNESQPIKIKLSTDPLIINDALFEFDFEKFVNGFNPFTTTDNPLIQRIDSHNKLKDCAIVYRGLETKDNSKWLSKSKLSDSYIPILLGRDVNRYFYYHSGTYVKFIKSEMKSNANEAMYSQPKILMRRTGTTIIATIDSENYIALKNLYLIIPKENTNIYAVLAQLNSRLFKYYHISKSSGENKAFAQFKGSYIESFPCKNSDNSLFETYINSIVELKIEINKINERFMQLLNNNLKLESTNSKPMLENSFSGLIDEIKKQKIKLAINDQTEWLEFFDKEKAKAIDLQNRINQTEIKIDQLVYALYDLTEEEIGIVEQV